MKYVDELSYLAAPNRNYLSLMARTMINYNLISPKDTHSDYGCGKGSDVKILREKGYNSIGYDPYYFPEYPTEKADIVSCGYVLNVLSKKCDRLEVIRKSWELTKSKLIVAVQTNSCLTCVRTRALIHVGTNHIATKLGKGIFLVEKSGDKLNCFSRKQVLEECKSIRSKGWVAPPGAFIKGYCSGFERKKAHFNYHPSFGLFPGRRYFRLCHKQSILPGRSGNLVKNIHLGIDKNSDRYRWAEAGIIRRNSIMRLKFNCSDLSFLDEFKGCGNWDFLDENWKPNPDPLGYTDQSKKPYHRNLNPGIPLI